MNTRDLATSSRTTAYASNTRNGARGVAISYAENPKIRSLLERDYVFLPLSYDGPGFLYRGIEVGFIASIVAGQFGFNHSDHSLATLERELGVILVSKDLSDAYALSRFWKKPQDAGIILISAKQFNRHYQAHNAATLGFAEPGVVFRYPFFSDPIAMHDVSYLIISRTQADYLEAMQRDTAAKIALDQASQLIVLDDDLLTLTRSELLQQIEQRLSMIGVSAAQEVSVAHYPTRVR